MTKKTYYVTDVAGPRPDIAGTRRRAGDTITLTDKEAEFELSRGVVISQEEHEKLEAEKREAKKSSKKPSA